MAQIKNQHQQSHQHDQRETKHDKFPDKFVSFAKLVRQKSYRVSKVRVIL